MTYLPSTPLELQIPELSIRRVDSSVEAHRTTTFAMTSRGSRVSRSM